MFRPYVANRFAAYGHVWEYFDTSGFQQTRTMIYSASGGLFGVGLGNGKLRDVYAATEDLVFGVVCEEFGMIMAGAILLSYVALLVYSIRHSKYARSSFYAICACAAASLMLFQAALNVFGVNDILPLTGVTLPFISRGGSSIISCWMLLAFIKAVDRSTYRYGGVRQ
jgi:cell division protein FtsW (lipid II flippase)